MSIKTLKKAAIGFMAAAMMMTVAGAMTTNTANAATVRKSGDYKYVKYLNGVKIKEYIGKGKKVTIPATIAGKKVIAIGESAFENNDNIKKVKLPGSVRKIEDCAFAGCNKLKKVTMPKKLDECGSAAFSGTALKNITIPEGIKEIEDYTFDNCKKLRTVKLSEDVKIIDNGAFENCEKLTTINLENIEEIRWNAFENAKSLKGNLVLKNVTTIESKAFFGCSGISSVEFSELLQKLGQCDSNGTEATVASQDFISGMTSSNPFAYCSNIQSFSVDVNNPNFTSVDGVIYGKTKQWLVAYPAKKQGDVNIDDNIKGISEYAFSGAQIGKVTMGKGLNTIHKKAFAKSTVTDVNMPLPDETKSVNWKADAFLNCASLKKVVFPEGIKSSYNAAFYNCAALTDVVLPESMESLSNAMFVGCASLQTVVLPKAVKKIPDMCFYKCIALSSINLENIEHVGGISFEECKSLTGVLNLNITSYDYGSFAECTGITEVNLNKPITALPEINYNVMRFSTPLYAIAEDEGVTSMQAAQKFDDRLYNTADNLFAECTKLTKINTASEGAVKGIDGVLFSSDLKVLIAFPAGMTGKYNIPYGVEKINNNAFAGANISEIVCSNSIEEIGSNAFSNSKVKAVTISKSVSIFDSVTSVFSGCSELEKIDVHASNNTFESIDGVLYRNVGKNKKLLVYPSAKKGKTLELGKNIIPGFFAFSDCKYLKKVYLNKLVDYNDGGRFMMFTNCKNIKLYLPKDFVPEEIDDDLKHYSRRRYSYGFDNADSMVKATCTGCKTYVKKGSKLAKKLDAKKIKYYKY